MLELIGYAFKALLLIVLFIISATYNVIFAKSSLLDDVIELLKKHLPVDNYD